jgi:hypothetical protein
MQYSQYHNSEIAYIQAEIKIRTNVENTSIEIKAKIFLYLRDFKCEKLKQIYRLYEYINLMHCKSMNSFSLRVNIVVKMWRKEY